MLSLFNQGRTRRDPFVHGRLDSSTFPPDKSLSSRWLDKKRTVSYPGDRLHAFWTTGVWFCLSTFLTGDSKCGHLNEIYISVVIVFSWGFYLISVLRLKSFKSEKESALTAFLILLALVMTQIPYLAMIVLRANCKSCLVTTWYFICQECADFLLCVSAIANPVLYGWRVKQFQRSFMVVFCGKKTRNTELGKSRDTTFEKTLELDWMWYRHCVLKEQKHYLFHVNFLSPFLLSSKIFTWVS